MKIFLALIYGSVTALVAVALHQSIPPFGVALSLLFTYIAIWLVGRHLNGRRYRWLSLFAWVALLFRASTFGVGQELLVQGDGVGTTLLLLGTLVALLAVAARI